MVYHRDRSEGWTHAKLSGHKNENLVNLLFDDPEFCRKFEKKLGISKIISHSVGGLCETSVESVLGDKTKSKADLVLTCEGGAVIKISIKKSAGGQVNLIRLNRLLEGLKKQFDVDVTDTEKTALELFFDCPDDNSIRLQIEQLKTRNDILPKEYRYMLKKCRVVAKYLDDCGEGYNKLIIDWFKTNIEPISRFCFSSGLVKDKQIWADYVWYINLINEESWGGIDTIFSIDDFCKLMRENVDTISYGTSLGGTTIQLPFGFVQWHQHQPQFHHSFIKIKGLIK